MFESIPDDVQIVIASAALLIAGIEFHRSYKNIKIRNFKTIYRLIAKGRFIYSDITREIYLSKYGNDVVKDSFLISKKDWIPEGLKDLDYLVGSYNECNEKIKRIWIKWLLKNGSFDFFVLPDCRSRYCENVRCHIEKNMFNGEGCRLINEPILKDGKLNLDMSNSHYFDYQDTCEYIGYQSVRRINKKSLYGYKCKNGHSDRACYLKNLFDFKNRYAMIGICTLTVIRNIGCIGNDYFLVHKRSNEIAEAMNTISLAPAGTMVWSRGSSMSQVIEDGVTREFDEEVLGMSELEVNEHYLPRDIWMDELGKSDKYKKGENPISIHFVSMGLDPLNTKMEIIVRLDIDASFSKILSFKNINSKMEGELSNKKTISLNNLVPGSYEGSLLLVPFSKENISRMMNDKRGMSVFREALRLTLRDM